MACKAETENIARAHRDFAALLVKEICEPLNKFRDAQKRERKKNITEAQKMTKDLMSGRNALEKYKEKYHRLHRECTATEKLLNTAKSGRAASESETVKVLSFLFSNSLF